MELWGPILFLLAATGGMLCLGLVTSWVDRKVTARVQYRVGPPFLQPVYDIVKLFGKETVLPESARRTGFLVAPLASFAALAVAATLIWMANLRKDFGFRGDLIVVIYLLTIPSLALILGGSSSGSPHAAVGASREMKLILSYELPLVIALLVPIVKMSRWTFSLGDMPGLAGGEPALYSLSGVIAFLVTIVCFQAKLGLVPFDIAEAETELMAGVQTEYSGPPLAMLQVSRTLLLATLPVLGVTVFWGGLGPLGKSEAAGAAGIAWGIVKFALKYLVIVVLLVLIRNTNPRIRVDHAVRFFWFLVTPLAAVALILALVGL